MKQEIKKCNDRISALQLKHELCHRRQEKEIEILKASKENKMMTDRQYLSSVIAGYSFLIIANVYIVGDGHWLSMVFIGFSIMSFLPIWRKTK